MLKVICPPLTVTGGGWAPGFTILPRLHVVGRSKGTQPTLGRREWCCMTQNIRYVLYTVIKWVNSHSSQQHQQLGVGPKITNEEIEAWSFTVTYYTVCIITGTQTLVCFIPKPMLFPLDAQVCYPLGLLFHLYICLYIGVIVTSRERLTLILDWANNILF